MILSQQELSLYYRFLNLSKAKYDTDFYSVIGRRMYYRRCSQIRILTPGSRQMQIASKFPV